MDNNFNNKYFCNLYARYIILNIKYFIDIFRILAYFIE